MFNVKTTIAHRQMSCHFQRTEEDRANWKIKVFRDRVTIEIIYNHRDHVYKISMRITPSDTSFYSLLLTLLLTYFFTI